jgi:hypothetical protein
MPLPRAAPTGSARHGTALQLVQDQIRYVYVGLDGGNYRPATVEETWARRYGDCKAKTVLLLAILRALDVPAEAVLVNAMVDDGADMRLPSPGAFNHVLVRATVGGRGLWLDGTRLGDRYVDRLPEPYFHWALPLREKGAPLEPVKRAPFTRPQFIGVMDVDASAGFDVPARVASTQILRGDDAWATRTTLSGMSRRMPTGRCATSGARIWTGCRPTRWAGAMTSGRAPRC